MEQLRTYWKVTMCNGGFGNVDTAYEMFSRYFPSKKDGIALIEDNFYKHTAPMWGQALVESGLLHKADLPAFCEECSCYVDEITQDDFLEAMGDLERKEEGIVPHATTLTTHLIPLLLGSTYSINEGLSILGKESGDLSSSERAFLAATIKVCPICHRWQKHWYWAKDGSSCVDCCIL